MFDRGKYWKHLVNLALVLPIVCSLAMGYWLHQSKISPQSTKLKLIAAEVELQLKAKTENNPPWLLIFASLSTGVLVGTSGVVTLSLWQKLQQQRIAKQKAELTSDRLFLFSQDLCCIATLGGYFLKVNPAWFKSLGYSEPELLNRSLSEFVHPEDRGKTQEAILLLAAGVSVTGWENRYWHRDGSERILAWNATVIEEDKCIYCVARDITNYRRTQQALDKYQNLYQQLVDSLPIIIYTTDAQGIITLCQGQILTELNLQPHQLLGTSIFSFCEDLPEVIKEICQVLAGDNRSWEFKYGNRCFYNQATPCVDEGGKVTGLVGICYDIATKEQLSAKEQFLQHILDTISDAVLVVNQEGKMLFSNSQVTSVFGRDRQTLEKYSFGLPVVNGKSTNITILRPEGNTIMAEMYCQSLKWENQPAYLISLRDITQRQEAESQVKATEERLHSILNSIGDIVWSAKPETYEVNFINLAVTVISGYSREQFYSNPNFWFEIIYPDDQKLVRYYLESLKTTLEVNFEYRIICSDQKVRWLNCRCWTVKDEDDQIIRIDGLETDITSRKEAEMQLQYRTFYDSLTNLPNRNLFLSHLEYACTNLNKKENYGFAVLILDIDEFKVVNDGLGHQAGDELLREIALRLKMCLKPTDFIARIGGDEFAILLENASTADYIVLMAEKIHDCLQKPIILNQSHQITVKTTMGFAFSHVQPISPQILLRNADIALYRAKQEGRNKYAIFNPQMQAIARKRLQREVEITQALEAEKFVLYYQPILSLSDRRIKGFEALVRMEHPTEGLLSPYEFIEIAEETGLIVPLGFWIFRQACQQLRRWQEQFPAHSQLQISINLSVKQFQEPSLIEQIEEILRETQVKPASVKLEITESLLMQEVEKNILSLRQLYEQKMAICVDDFGTGYSSLSYLHRFPLNILKIDRDFVKNLESSHESKQIIQIIVSLAKSLGLETIAEGIETENQVQFLQQIGCQQGQGYLFAKPLSEAEATAYLHHSLQPPT